MEQYFDVKYIYDAFPKLLPFLKITILITVISVILGTFLGFIVAYSRLCKYKILNKIGSAYVTTLRCTPSIVLLFLVYYGIPAIFASFNIDIDNVSKLTFILITFTMQFGAVMGEIIRSAYIVIDKGQYEAAVSIGLNNIQAIYKVILPQGIFIALPNIGNAIIAIMKEGALAYTIGMLDMMGKANLIIANNYNAHALETFIALSVIYWALSIIIENVFKFLENKLGRGLRLIKN